MQSQGPQGFQDTPTGEAATPLDGAGPVYAIALAEAPEDWAAVGALFRAYAESIEIPACHAEVALDIGSLPQPFDAPDACVLIARTAGNPAGCVAIKRAPGEDTAEMARLYVAPEHRRHGLGRRLAERAIAEAAARGYHGVVLHTMAGWRAARALYDALGFMPAEPYVTLPIEDVVYYGRAVERPSTGVNLSVARFPEDLAAVRALFAAYAETFPVPSCRADLDRELDALPEPYAGDGGQVLLARASGRPVGSVALKDRPDRVVKLARLYVAPAMRRRGLGRALSLRAMLEAQTRGYERMVLYTLPAWRAALALYAELGFERTEPLESLLDPSVLCLARSLGPGGERRDRP